MAIGVVALLAVALVAFFVGRATVAAPTSTKPARPTAQPSASAPSGAGGVWPGASRLDNGVPVGYADTQQGAVQAATNFSDVLNSAEFVLHPAAYRTAIRTMAAPSWSVDPEARLAPFATAIAAAANGTTVIVRAFFLGYHVDSYSAGSASVTVFGGGLSAIDGQSTPAIAILAETYALEWVGDWRVTNEGTTFRPGLQLGNPAPQTNRIPDQLKQATGGYSYAPRP